MPLRGASLNAVKLEEVDAAHRSRTSHAASACDVNACDVIRTNRES